MRAHHALLAFAASLALPLAAQTARFIKVDVTSKSARHHMHMNEDGEKTKAKSKSEPLEVHIRMPIALAKSILQSAGDSEIKVNGESKKGLKTDELVKLLETSKPGEMLLELDTNDGDHVRIGLE
jgi:hypothetical protein